VNRLLKQFADAKKMMKSLAGSRGVPNLESLMSGQQTKR
jgi:signal recognition particle GTPase